MTSPDRTFQDQINQRLNSLDGRINNLESRMDSRLTSIENRISHMTWALLAVGVLSFIGFVVQRYLPG